MSDECQEHGGNHRLHFDVSLVEAPHFVRRLLAASANLVYIYDLVDHCNVYASRDMLEFLGHTEAQIRESGSQLMTTIIHPEDVARVVQHHARFKTAADDEICTIEYRVHGANGQWRWLGSHDVVFARGADGVPSQILGTAEDITARKAHERELTRMNRLYDMFSLLGRTLVRATSREAMLRDICDLIVAKGGFHLAWVGWVDAHTGEVLQEAKAGEALECLEGISVRVDDRPEGRGPTGTCIRENRTYVCRDFFNDPAMIPWQATAKAFGLRCSVAIPLRIRDQAVGALAVYSGETNAFLEKEVALLEEVAAQISIRLDHIRDLAERKQVEGTLIEQGERLRQAINVSQIGIFDHDQTTNRIYWSPQQRLIHGVDPELPITLDLFIANLHPDDLEAVLAAIHQAHDPTGDGIWIVEHRIVRPNGVIRWLKGRSQTFFEGDGDARHPVRTIGAVVDITEQRKTEEERQKLQDQLAQAQKMESVGQLASGIAHDFNNVLAIIFGYANILQMKMGTEHPLHVHVNQILAAAERASGLTQSLLAFSRKQVITPEVVDLNEVIRKAEKFLARVISEDIQMSTTLEPRALVVHVDVMQVEHVLLNLATNARDAMPKGGRLLIETTHTQLDDEYVLNKGYGTAGAYVVLTVSDTGQGMDEQTQNRIFEPFFTTKELGKGTGLGLAMVYGMVKQNNGYINVYSELGRGTTFKIYLPMIDPSGITEPSPVEKLPLVGGTETILFAEDNESLRQLYKGLMEEFGYTVIEAADGAEALQVFMENQDRINLVILDVIMPKTNGREVYEEAKRSRPSLKAIFTSGYPADLIHIEGVLEAGINFLSKPFSSEVLLQKVRRVLDQP